MNLVALLSRKRRIVFSSAFLSVISMGGVLNLRAQVKDIDGRARIFLKLFINFFLDHYNSAFKSKMRAVSSKAAGKYFSLFSLALFPIVLALPAFAQVTISQNFDGGTTMPPTGWTVSGANSSYMSIVTSGTYPSNSPHSSPNECRYNSYSVASGNAFLTSPAFSLANIGSNVDSVVFWMYRESGYSSTGDSVSAYINTSTATTSATYLGRVARSSSIAMPTTATAGTWNRYAFAIPSAYRSNAPATNYMIFKFISHDGNDCYIDDISWVSYPASCTGTPTAGTASASVSTACPGTTFSLSLTGYTNQAGITLQWQSSPSGANTWSNMSGATSSGVTAPAISSNTDYRCAVTCTNSNQTAYSNTVTVSAYAASLPYSEGFESTTANNQMPNCMTATNIGTRTFTYTAAQSSYGRAAHSGSHFGSYYYPSNDYFFTPGFNLTGGQTYQFSFWYVTDGYTGWLTLGGYYGTSATAAAMTTAIGTPLSNVTNTTYQQYSGTFTPASSGTYYIGVYCYGNSVPYYLSIDDISLAALPACTGTPTAGTAAVNVGYACASTAINLSLSGTTAATGINYQWQSSPTGTNIWSNISGATTSSYTYTGQSASSDYRCVVTCANSTQSANSNTITVNQSPCYCAPAYSSSSTNYKLTSFSLTAANSTSISDGTVSNYAYSYYADRTGVVAAPQMQQGVTYSGTIVYPYGYYQYSTIWIDFNDNGTFEASENVSGILATNCLGTLSYSYNLSVPITAPTGYHRMRVRDVYTTGICTAPTSIDPCSSYSYGEARDYEVQITAAPSCSGTPTAGAAFASLSSVCSGASFSLSDTGFTYLGGISLQWQSSPTGANTWSNISGATSATFNISQTAATDYRCVVTCSFSSQVVYSNTATVTMNSPTNCYCTPSYTYAFSSPYYMSNFSLTGASSTAINDGTANSYTPSSNYTNRTSAFSAVSLQQGLSYSGSITFDYGYYMYAVIWIDFNDDGFFTSNEQVTGLMADPCTSTSPYTYNFTNLSIPIAANTGNHRMRVRSFYYSNYCVAPTVGVDPCSVSDANSYLYWYGDTRDYIANITAAPACSGTPTVGTASSSISQACPASSFTLSLSGYTIASGLVFQWQSSPTGANTWTNITGANNTTCTISSISAATDYRCVLTCTGSSQSSTSNTVTVSAISESIHYFEGFESITANNQLPSCMTSTHLGSLTYTYTTATGSYNQTAHSGSKFGSYYYPSNDYFFTPGLTLTAGVTYNVSFWYITDGYTGWLTLGAYYGSSATASAMTTAVGTPLSNVINTTYSQYSGTFTPATSGIYFIGIYCYGNTVPYYLSIDDISVTVVPTVTGATSYCIGNTLSLTASSSAASPSYSWTGPNSFTANTASISIPNLTAANAGNYSVTVTSNGIAAAAVIKAVSVNPIPTVNSLTNQSLCNGVNLAATFSGSVSGTTYNWINTNTAIGLAASGAGNISTTTANSGTSIVSGTITVTPTVVSTGCTGSPTAFNVTVYPTATLSQPGNQTLCSGVNTTAVNFSGPVSGTTYTWANNNALIGLGSTGSGNIATFTATNSTATQLSGTVTVTPTANGCAGTNQTFTYTVNPTPTVTAISNQAVCNGSSTSTITVGGSIASGTSYNWTNSNTAIGLPASGSGNILSFSPVNTTNAPAVATVTVTPVTSTCQGTPAVFTITDKPIPSVISPTSQAICNGVNSTITAFSSTVSGTTYAWSNDNTAIGLAASGSGSIASFQPVNTGTTPILAHLLVTPTANGCLGSVQTDTIAVNPSPAMNSISNQTLCNGSTTANISFTSTIAGTAFNWINSAAIGIGQSGSGNIASFAALNAGPNIVTSNFTVTPVANLCAGMSQNFSITVNPTPVAIVPASVAACNGTVAGQISFSSATGGTTYAWTNTNMAIGLGASGSGNIATFNAIDTGNTPVSSSIAVTPLANTCVGTPSLFTLTVNPTPIAGIPLSQTVCNNTNTNAVVFSSSVSSSTYAWVNSNTSIGLAASGSGNIAAFQATNIGTSQITANLSVTPFANGCQGAPQNFQMAVNPSLPASLNISVAQGPVICSNSPASFSVTATSNPGILPLYQWKVNNVNVGINANSYNTSTLSNNDVVTCVMTSSALCPSPTNATSNAITMTVNNVLVPSVSISAQATTLCPGVRDTFTAVPVNGGANPSYQWKKNGIIVGTNSAVYSDNTLNNNDLITCVMTSSSGCAVPNTASSNPITIAVNPTPNLLLPANQTLCNGINSGTYSFYSSVNGTTYAWTNNATSIGLAASGNGTITPFQTTNTISFPVTATITVTPTANGCSGSPQSFNITVNPTASLTMPANQSICNGNATNAVNFSGSTVIGTTYSWVNNNTSFGIGSGAAGNMPSFSVSNAGTAPVSAVITVTPLAYGCTGTTQSFNITVNPSPAINAVPNQTICNGALTSPVSFSSPVTGCTFNWTNSISAIGLAASGVGNIPQFYCSNLTNNTVNATITVTASYSGCPGPSQSFVYHVLPVNMNQPLPQIFCNGANATVPVFTSGVSGTTYSWWYSSAGIGLQALGSGNIPAFTAVNTSNAPVLATITVTPSANGCTGNSQSLSITVNPTPSVANPGNQTFCNGASSQPLNFSGNVSGTTYTWINNNVSIGLAASGAGNIATFAATNTTSNQLVANVAVIPNANSCAGPAANFNITIQPSPALTSSLTATACSNTPFTYTPASNYSSATYSWTRAAVSGISNGAGNGTGSVSETLTNTTTSTVLVNYIYTLSAGGCANPATYTVAVTVNPAPVLSALSNQVLCNGNTASAVNFSSSVPGATYSWTNNNTSVGLGASGNGNIASFTASNISSSIATAGITVMPSFNGCQGIPQTFTIAVNPVPTVSATPNQALCNSTNSGTLFLGGSAVNGTIYNWTNSNTAIGLSASGSGSIASFPAVNTTNSPVSATVSVVPAANGCSGITSTFTITVNPTPSVTLPSNSSLCSGASFNGITFNGTVSGSTYSWTNNNTAIGLSGAGTGNISSFTVTNTTNAALVATLAVAPSANGCAGVAQNMTITVSPTATVNTISNQSICNGINFSGINFSGAASGTSYTWTNNTTSIGLAASGAGNIGSFVVSDNSSSPVVANISVSPVVNGCTGTPQNFTITVNPTPGMSSLTNKVVCNGVNTSTVVFSGSAVSGTVYTWASANTSIGLPATGVGNISSFIAVNGTNTTVNDTISVAPYANACYGPVQSFILTVNPTPTATLPASQTLCSGANVAAFSFSGTVSGTTYGWSNNTTSIGLGGSGNGNIASFTALNPGTSVLTATISVIPSANACVGTLQNFTITVKPMPSVTVPSDQVVCSGLATSLLNFSSNINGTVFNWTNTNASTGLAASGSGNISSFVAVNSTAATVIDTISVAPVAAGCTGTVQNFRLSVKPTPVLTSSLYTSSVCDNTTVTYVPSSTINATTYSWSRAAVTGIIPATGSGSASIVELLHNTSSGPIVTNYVYTLNYNGCLNTYNISDTIKPTPVLTSSPTPPAICDSAAFSYTPTSTVSGTAFNWSRAAVPGISNPAANGTGNPNEVLTNTSFATVAVTYIYTLSANGCSGVGASGITVPVYKEPSVIVPPSSTTICAGANATFSLASGGTNVGYQWQENAGAGFSNITNGGMYGGATSNALTLSGTIAGMNGFQYRCVLSNQCSAAVISAAATLNIHTLPAVTAQPSNATLCLGNNASFNVSGSGTGISYQWQVNPGSGFLPVIDSTTYSGATSPTLSITAPTPAMSGYLYRCIISGACTPVAASNNAILTVHPDLLPPVTYAGLPSICYGDSLKLRVDTGTAYTYQWMQNGQNIAGATDSAYIVSDSGTYSVTVVNNFGCTNTSLPLVITERPVPPASLNIIQGTTSFCSGGSIELGTGMVSGFTYQWLKNNLAIPGAVSATYLADSLGYYKVTVTENGCSATSASQLVIVFASPSDTIIAPGNHVICSGSAGYVISAIANANLQYQWYENGNAVGANSSYYLATIPGVYNAFITSSNGCNVFTKSVTLSGAASPSPVIAAVGFTLSTGSYVSYQWYRDGIGISGAVNQNYTYTQNGIYTVQVTDTNGCSSTSQAYTVSNLGIRSIPASSIDLDVYPNPATSVLNIEASVKVNVSIFTLEGSLMIHKDDARKLDISELANGVYLLQVFDENNTLLKTARIVKNSW